VLFSIADTRWWLTPSRRAILRKDSPSRFRPAATVRLARPVASPSRTQLRRSRSSNVGDGCSSRILAQETPRSRRCCIDRACRATCRCSSATSSAAAATPSNDASIGLGPSAIQSSGTYRVIPGNPNCHTRSIVLVRALPAVPEGDRWRPRRRTAHGLACRRLGLEAGESKRRDTRYLSNRPGGERPVNQLGR
jgi:hypothetical protein